jgi:hypothetical protein
MIHPHTEIRFISEQKGYGVVATRFIPKGTITWVQDPLDRTFTESDIARLDKLYQDILNTYTFRNRDGEFVLCWDNARFVNHSFNSSCMSTAYDFEIAICDIHPGEELTDDYGYLNIAEPFDVVPEEGCDRTTVYPDDLLRYHQQWDDAVRQNFPAILNVDQPLMRIVPEVTQQIIREISTGSRTMESILSNYFDPATVRKQH